MGVLCMPELDLTVQQWRYLSVLVENQVNREQAYGLDRLVAVHRELFELLQPVCEWNEEASDQVVVISSTWTWRIGVRH